MEWWHWFFVNILKTGFLGFFIGTAFTIMLASYTEFLQKHEEYKNEKRMIEVVSIIGLIFFAIAAISIIISVAASVGVIWTT